MKKKYLAVLSAVLLSGVLSVPVFADTNKTLQDFTIKAFQEKSTFVLNVTSSGSYLGLTLDKNGSVDDNVDFYGTAADSAHTVITNTGTAKEGSGKTVWVKYNDNKSSRTLYSMVMKSTNFNGGSYTVNGTITY